MKGIDESLHFETVSTSLLNALMKLMGEPLFDTFRLVGGTNLSLRLGHRKSEDIDLFSDAEYGSLDFRAFHNYLVRNFPYCDPPILSEGIGFGRMYYVGLNKDTAIKLDLMYTDPFLAGPEVYNGIRMARLEEICAMKLEAIGGGGRKKDWWDIHELLNYFSLKEMLAAHAKWQPWTHDEGKMLDALVDFSSADKDAQPVCLKGKDWDTIKIDIINTVRDYI